MYSNTTRYGAGLSFVGAFISFVHYCSLHRKYKILLLPPPASGHLAASQITDQSAAWMAALCHLIHIPKLPTVEKVVKHCISRFNNAV